MSEENGEILELQDRLRAAQAIVIKVGTRLVASPEGEVNRPFLDALAQQCRQLLDRGIKPLVVTSGAVYLGRRRLALSGRAGVSLRQAMAAIGQPELMRHYCEAFEARGLRAAQILLTADDMVHRERFLNVRNTIEALHRQGAVPIVNENDTVSIEGVTFGENDRLAALVAITVRADGLIFLSDQPGLFTADPRSCPDARLVRLVRPGDEVSRFAGGAGGPESAGGMAKKIEAAEMAADCGIIAVIAEGTDNAVIRILDEQPPPGTWFQPRRVLDARKAWIATAAGPAGEILIDEGAMQAILAPDGASLLPVGITDVRGDFRRGDLVIIRGPDGQEIARGLVNYDAAELRKIMGRRTSEIRKILGRHGDDEAVHRDNMAITRPASL